uniref:Uncharacterized protein n=1 Tax=Rhizophora mucronata TaxID=61149 RepID=A0A2P2PL74_RHIMU
MHPNFDASGYSCPILMGKVQNHCIFLFNFFICGFHADTHSNISVATFTYHGEFVLQNLGTL